MAAVTMVGSLSPALYLAPALLIAVKACRKPEYQMMIWLAGIVLLTALVRVLGDEVKWTEAGILLSMIGYVGYRYFPRVKQQEEVDSCLSDDRSTMVCVTKTAEDGLSSDDDTQQSPLLTVLKGHCDRGTLSKEQCKEILEASVSSFGYPGDRRRNRSQQIGPYRILGLIKSGGGGQVFRCEKDGKTFAVKVPRKNVVRKWFDREMQLILRLAHPNVVIGHEFGWHEGLPYIAMEFLDGPDLKDLVKARGSLTAEMALSYIKQAAYGLKHAADRGIVHRDVKLANLVLHNGIVKVTDFGLATSKSVSNHLSDDEILGTYGYMAPEQASSSHAASHLSDIYSLGVSWLLLLEGRTCHDANGAVPALKLTRDIPDSHRRLLESMLSASPQGRPASWTEFLDRAAAITQHDEQEAVVKVLLVEDNEDEMLLTTRVLEAANSTVQVVHAARVSDAVSCLQQHEIDVVLLDLELPDSQGLNTLDLVNEETASPVIVLTGNADPEVRRLALDAGARGYLYKSQVSVDAIERSVFGSL
jgi:serine/threonine protein kinase